MKIVDKLSARIKEHAIELGFTQVGIARAERLDADAARFFSWLDRSFHGDMAWLEREPEKRTDPRSIFPDAVSVISLAMNYYTPTQHTTDATAGKISRYAWGDDYHDVVKEKLRELLGWIVEEEPGAAGKVCVDTAPVMEKAWAMRAGVGWIGKQLNVITKVLGSWVFLGEIYLTFALMYVDHIAD